jgi:subtilisin family serine protease
MAAGSGSGHMRRVDAPSDTPLGLVRLPGLMAMTAGISSVVVALIDGPVALRHPDLAADTIRTAGEDSSAACRVADSVACAHGTFVAGVLNAKRDSSNPGICPGCTLLVRPIFSDAVPDQADGLPSATPDRLALAVLEAIKAGAQIINLSVGLSAPGLGAERALEEALTEAARRGVIVAAAAGNQGVLGSSAITRHPWVIPVVACDRGGRVLAPSNLGASIGRRGVTAPGGEIPSLAAAGGHAKFSGSSAAVPFVSGTAALLWSLFPRASPAELRLAIAGGSARRSVTPPLLDARAAHDALTRTRGMQAR